MSDSEEVPTKKESAVLSDASLCALAKELGPLGLVMSMYLNIPTTTLVNMRLSTGDQAEEDLTLEALKYWRTIRASAKDRDKVNDLERALREAGKQDAADVIQDRHRDNEELTEDCFPEA